MSDLIKIAEYFVGISFDDLSHLEKQVYHILYTIGLVRLDANRCIEKR